MHTSTKARLTSVAIRIRDPDRHQNLTICSLAHCQPSRKFHANRFRSFLCKVANRQTNRRTTTMITYPPWRMMVIDNYVIIMLLLRQLVSQFILILSYLKPCLHDRTCCQTGCQTRVCIHDTTGCQTHCQTGCIVYINIQPALTNTV